MEQFCPSYNLKSLVKKPTCVDTSCVDNPSCIDAILKNYPQCCQNAGAYETGISEFQILTFVVCKKYFHKAKPRIIKYRDYKHFDNNDFRDEMIRELFTINIQSDYSARFTNISEMILLEKRRLRKKGTSDITKLSL